MWHKRFHNHHPIEFNSNRGGINLETEKTHDGTTSRLLLTRAQFRDGGNYSCNPLGAIPASGFVHVLNGERHFNTLSKAYFVNVIQNLWYVIWFSIVFIYQKKVNIRQQSIRVALLSLASQTVSYLARHFYCCIIIVEREKSSTSLPDWVDYYKNVHVVCCKMKLT